MFTNFKMIKRSTTILFEEKENKIECIEKGKNYSLHSLIDNDRFLNFIFEKMREGFCMRVDK